MRSSNIFIQNLPKKQFVKKYPINKVRKVALQKVKNLILKQKKMKTLFNIAVTNKKDKEDIWYLNIAIAIHIMHNFSFYIILNLNNQIINIKTANSIIFKI